jgi:hypothetical protein
METVAEFSREEKLREIAREIAMRRRVYSRRIIEHRMSRTEADRSIAIMLAIARDYGGHGDQH